MNLRNTLAAAGCGLLLAAATVGAAGAAGTAGAAGAAGTAPAPAAAPRPGHWSRVTANGLGNTADIGLARGKDGILHVLWLSGGAAGTFRIMDTPIAADGAVRRTVAVSRRFFDANNPDATVTPSGPAVFWDGSQTGAPTSPSGTFEATRPARGGSWHVGSPVAAVNDNWDLSVGATTGSGGRPWVTFGVSGGIAVLHYGHPEQEIGISQCCQYDEGIGSDGRSGATWATYFSNVTRHTGVFAQPLLQTGHRAGPARLLPGSQSHGNAVSPRQRVTATGLGHGRSDVYTSYLSGYPFARAVDLYRLGARSAVAGARLASENDIGLTTLAADPRGRIWVAWAGTTSGQARLFVRRAKKAASGFGKTGRVRLPGGTADIWQVYLNAQAGRLDVVALLTVHGKMAYWATQVLPPKA